MYIKYRDESSWTVAGPLRWITWRPLKDKSIEIIYSLVDDEKSYSLVVNTEAYLLNNEGNTMEKIL